MRIPVQLFSPLVEALLTTPFKLHAQMEPRTILSQLAAPVRAAEVFNEFSQPLQGLSQLIKQMEDPIRQIDIRFIKVND